METNLMPITKLIELCGGHEPHRRDFTEAMLPPGLRPLLKGEGAEPYDEYLNAAGLWRTSKGYPAASTAVHYRTRRPLPDTERERVPLEAGDVPPGSAIRQNDSGYCLVLAAGLHTLAIINDGRGTQPVTYKELAGERWLILRPGSTEWEPCSKAARKAQ